MLYFLLEPILSPLFEMISGFLESIEVFIAIYIVLMNLGDFTEKTVFQHFFSTARVLFFMDYLLFFTGDSLFTASCKSLSLTVNSPGSTQSRNPQSSRPDTNNSAAINFIHEKA